MTYTETTTTSYGKRLGDSIKGIFFGIILIIASIILLSWNEGRTIKVTTGLAEGAKITMKGEISPINSAMEGKLVHINGKADTAEILMDDIFTVQKNAIKLIRTVRMYQWKETSNTTTRDNVGGSETKTTTYTYSKDWSEEQINSSGFKESGHDNPANWNIQSETFTSTGVKIGDMKLSSDFVNRINKEEPVLLDTKDFQMLRIFQKLGKGYTTTQVDIDNNIIYIGTSSGSLGSPEIGDFRISFTAVYPAEVSVIGQQRGDTLTTYITNNNMPIALLQYGNISIEQMYEQANSINKFLAWILRGVGLMLMFLGFNLLFGLIVMIAKIIPFIADILSIGTGLISFMLTLIIGGGAILITWLFVRPLMSALIGVVVLGIVFMIIKSKKKSRGSGAGMGSREM